MNKIKKVFVIISVVMIVMILLQNISYGEKLYYRLTGSSYNIYLYDAKKHDVIEKSAEFLAKYINKNYKKEDIVTKASENDFYLPLFNDNIEDIYNFYVRPSPSSSNSGLGRTKDIGDYFDNYIKQHSKNKEFYYDLELYNIATTFLEEIKVEVNKNEDYSEREKRLIIDDIKYNLNSIEDSIGRIEKQVEEVKYKSEIDSNYKEKINNINTVLDVQNILKELESLTEVSENIETMNSKIDKENTASIQNIIDRNGIINGYDDLDKISIVHNMIEISSKKKVKDINLETLAKINQLIESSSFINLKSELEKYDTPEEFESFRNNSDIVKQELQNTLEDSGVDEVSDEIDTLNESLDEITDELHKRANVDLTTLDLGMVTNWSDDVLSDPTDFNVNGELPSEVSTTVSKIVGAIQYVGSIIAVIVLIYIGIKYIIGSVEEKAEYKGTLVKYLIGVGLLLLTINITAFIYNVVT